MVNIGWPELFVVTVIAVVVIKPKDYPSLIRNVRNGIRLVKNTIGSFRSSLDEVVREADLVAYKQEIKNNLAADSSLGKTIVNPLRDLKAEIDQPVQQLGAELDKAKSDLKTAATITANSPQADHNTASVRPEKAQTNPKPSKTAPQKSAKRGARKQTNPGKPQRN